jgi:hypothetical protein
MKDRGLTWSDKIFDNTGDILLVILAACGSSAAKTGGSAPDGKLQTVTVVIPGQQGGQDDILWYGLQQGIFRKYGIDLKIAAPSSASSTIDVTYLQENKYDVGMVGAPTFCYIDRKPAATWSSFTGSGKTTRNVWLWEWHRHHRASAIGG